MKITRKLTITHNLITRSSFVLPKLAALGLALALVALALVAQRRFAATAQEPSDGRAPGIHLIEIASDPNGSTGIAHHQPSNSLLLSSAADLELFGAGGARTAFSRIGAHQGALAAVRESRNGFIAGEVFAGADTPGAIVRISPIGSFDQIPWITLPGETGLVRGLYFDNQNSSASSSESVFGGDLIAVTTNGGVWRIDSAGNALRATAMVTALSDDAVESPVSFDSVTLAPNDPAKYGALAGKILALAGRQGLIYAVDAEGRVESFNLGDLGLRHINNLLVIPTNENFFGVTIDRRTDNQQPGQPENQTRNRGTIRGAPAADFAGMAGDLLVTQTGGEDCQCQTAIWRVKWNGAGFENTKLAEIPGAPYGAEWGQVTFSPFGDELFNEINEAGQQANLSLVKSVTDLNGGFAQPGDTLEYTLTLSNPSPRPVAKSFIAEFIPSNTDYVANSARITAGANAGAKTDAIDNDQVDAFAVGARVIQINIGTGTGAGGHDSGGRLIGGTLAPGESTTVVFRVTVKAGLSEGAPIVNGAEFGVEDIYPAGKSNVVANTVGSPLKLEKSVTDLNGGQAAPGDTLEYKLKLTNQSFDLVAKTFIAEFIPKGVTYVAGSVQITAGANTGAKTDAIDADQVDYYPVAAVNGQINIAIGAGAGGHDAIGRLIGGAMATGESTTVVLRVKINTGAGVEAIVSNGANAGANDIYPIAVSNIVAVTVVCPTITLSPAAGPLPVGTVGTAYSQTFTRTGGVEPVTFSVSAGSPPPGLTLNATTGVLTGTPTQSGNFSFTITATDAGACTGGAAYTLVINPSCTPPAITAQPASLVRTSGQSATFSVTATGTNLTYQWRKDGVNIAGATGSSFTIASVKTSDAGSYDVVVMNACGTVTSTAAALTVNCQTITISPVALPVGAFGTAYSQTITQTGGVAPVTFSLSAGAPPSGLTLNATTGVLSGTPTQVGQFSFTIKVTDANGCAGIQPYLLPITPSAAPECRQTICFRSAAYFSLNFGTSAIPNGTLLIGGVNLNNPVASTDQRVKQALDGQLGALNREFVAAQLNILGASGLGAADVVTALASELSCYGLQFGLVRLSNGVILTPQSSLSELIAASNFVAKGGGDSKDNCIVTKLLGALNGTSSANVCTRPVSPVDLSGCL